MAGNSTSFFVVVARLPGGRPSISRSPQPHPSPTAHHPPPTTVRPMATATLSHPPAQHPPRPRPPLLISPAAPRLVVAVLFISIVLPTTSSMTTPPMLPPISLPRPNPTGFLAAPPQHASTQRSRGTPNLGQGSTKSAAWPHAQAVAGSCVLRRIGDFPPRASLSLLPEMPMPMAYPRKCGSRLAYREQLCAHTRACLCAAEKAEPKCKVSERAKYSPAHGSCWVPSRPRQPTTCGKM